MDLSYYKTLVFDCDGVILNSNKVKTKAFYEAALPYGEYEARELVAYHIKHGGISRYTKFETFLRDIVKIPITAQALDQLLGSYASEVQHGLLHCETASGLEALRDATSHARWAVVSGGDQAELRSVFAQRNIDLWFDAGIFGSPDDKDTILAREFGSGKLVRPAIFLGDSRYDHEAAIRAKLDFVFVSGWSEFHGFEAYCKDHYLVEISKVIDLLCSRKPIQGGNTHGI